MELFHPHHAVKAGGNLRSISRFGLFFACRHGAPKFGVMTSIAVSAPGRKKGSALFCVLRDFIPG
jgi:hypothetical protein